MQHSQEFIDLVNAARENIKECSVSDVKSKMDQGDDFILIDVREESEFAVSHLPDARHIGRGVLEVKVIQTIPDKSTELVLYCGGGYRSALAAESLVKMGYQNVISMDGGFGGWNKSGYPLIKG